MTEVILNIKDTHTSRRFALWFTEYSNGDFAFSFGKQKTGKERPEGWCRLELNTRRFGPPLEVVRAFREAFQELEGRLSSPSLETGTRTSLSVVQSPSL